ncbi:MAG: pyridoxal phosphate-dependent aminotransferase [Candidatus Cloacimonetes bacterium]|nr:pyridoxal phosphate-dependent aminotransferase [Candidatus Cloacimonadota bacterium]MDD4155620.1 pyridoxal phosphate-dependent aminotransferase [Candidatus Cloacimonadota bacterium]
MIAKHLLGLKPSLIREMMKGVPKDAINLGLGEIRFKTPKIICDEAINYINNANIFYSENAGIKELRELIAINYNTTFDKICVTNGAQEALFTCLFSLLNPNDKILIGNPTFLAYETIAKLMQAEVLKFDFDRDNNFRLNKDSFLEKIKLKPKILLITHPSNPTGIAFNNEEMQLIVKQCLQHNVLLIVDEVYLGLNLTKRIPSFSSINNNLIIISSLSKLVCMTGWRLGWIVCHNKDLLSKIILSHQYISTCASTISQYAAIKAFSTSAQIDIDSIKEQLLINYNICLQKLASTFPEINTTYLPDAAPYLFLRIHCDDLSFATELSTKGVIIIPGSAFGQNGYGYIRICYAIEKENLIKALDKLTKFYRIKLTK